MSRPALITGDGESVVAKTSVCAAMGESMPEDVQVEVLVAGDYFRRTAAASLEEAASGPQGLVADPDRFERIVTYVLEYADLYGGRNWGDLESKHVEEVVSKVGRLSVMQHNFSNWVKKTTYTSIEKGVEVVIWDGRNIRDRLEELIDDGTVISALDLMVDCAPKQAALRSVKRRYENFDEMPEWQKALALTEHEEFIMGRRISDRTKEVNPFLRPRYMLRYHKALTPAGAIERSRDWGEKHGDDRRPQTILFDTTYMEFEQMKQDAAQLALAAIDLPAEGVDTVAETRHLSIVDTMSA